jgi:hypothetical protein
MLRLKRLLLILPPVCLMGLIIALSGRHPLSIRVVSINPSGILDDAGRECSTVTLGTTNRSGRALYFDRHCAEVAAKVDGRWIELPSGTCPSRIGPQQPGELELLVPASTDACRLKLRYVREPIQFTLMRLLGRLGLWRHGSARALARRLLPTRWQEPQMSDLIGKDPHWRVMSLEAAIPG